MSKRRVVIIGAGLSGLTAAWRLRQHGLDPIVFEAEREPGGRARSSHDTGSIHDLGAWTFTAKGPVIRLANEVGLTGDIVTIPLTVGRPVNGRLCVANLHQPHSLIGTAFTATELLSLGRVMWQARTLPKDGSDEPAAKWATRCFSEAFTQDVLEPLAALYFLQDLNGLSRNALLGTFDYLFGIQLHSFRAGMGHLPSFLAAQLPVRYGAKIEAIQLDQERVRVTGQGFAEAADGLIVATPLPETIRILERYLSRELIEAASGWRYAPTLGVRLLLRGYWPKIALQVLPPRNGEWLSCGLTMERAKDPTRVPDGYELLAMYARPDRVAALIAKSDDELANLFAAELNRWFPMRRCDVERFWVQRWQHAAAFTDLGVLQRVQVMDEGFRTLARIAPIWAAGDFRGISGLPGAVKSAEHAVSNCLDYFAKLTQSDGVL